MKITYKALYQILAGYYLRRSVSEYLKQDVEPNIFKAAQFFALTVEDYLFLETFRTENLEQLDNEFSIFASHNWDQVILLEKKENFTLLEAALIYGKCQGTIPLRRFEDVIEAQSEYLGMDSHGNVDVFSHLVESLETQE